ncbi:MAG TPA: substrate-binding domain-containing protein [Rhodanobacteraceae bacterium]|nr:substrate-binding domain-containing protein [Rhodanobacteraceae bacterium]
MTFHFRHLLVTASLLLAAGAALAGPPPLVWRGDVTTANNFVNDMARAWHKAGHPRITLQPFNTVSGIDAVAHGTADIAGSVRGRAPRRADESNLVFTPVAWDGLVMITNHRNPVDGLTLKQLHDIYYGKITNWSQVGGKNEPIHVYAVASPTDGIEFSLRRLLFGRGNQPVAAPRLYLSVTALQKAVALDPQSLGVTTLSNAHGESRLKMLNIDGHRPTVNNVADGSYPLYTPLYLVTRPAANTSDPAKAKEVAEFVAFAQDSEVASILHRHRLIPYNDALALAGHDDQRIADIARETGRHVYHHNRPTAAPGATYAARAAIAPTSERTLAAHRHMMAKREADKAAKVRAHAAKAQRSFDASSRADASQTQVTWYTVVSGDTLSKIAQKQSVSVEQLRAWNHIKGNLIQVGQKLAIHH